MEVSTDSIRYMKAKLHKLINPILICQTNKLITQTRKQLTQCRQMNKHEPIQFYFLNKSTRREEVHCRKYKKETLPLHLIASYAFSSQFWRHWIYQLPSLVQIDQWQVDLSPFYQITQSQFFHEILDQQTGERFIRSNQHD